MPRRPRAEESTALTLRVPTELIERVRQIAVKEDRTLTAQLIRVIREWLEQQERPA
jgi:predicted transcriptional regulator